MTFLCPFLELISLLEWLSNFCNFGKSLNWFFLIFCLFKQFSLFNILCGSLMMVFMFWFYLSWLFLIMFILYFLFKIRVYLKLWIDFTIICELFSDEGMSWLLLFFSSAIFRGLNILIALLSWLVLNFLWPSWLLI